MRKIAGVILKTVLFLALCLAILIQVNNLFQPRWEEWNNYNTIYGFYKEPKNTIETLFLGTSTTVNGIIPTDLYEKYGMAAYNMGTEQQPMIASLAWLKETYRLHGKSLKTVVFDVSSLKQPTKYTFFHKAIDGMHFSKVKIDVAREYGGSLKNSIKYLLPLLTYHGRWDSLTTADLKKYYVEPAQYFRGYHFSKKQSFFTNNELEEIPVPVYRPDESVEPTEFNADSVKQFLEMVEFCKEKNLNLQLVKVPVVRSWKLGDHKAMVKLLEDYGLTDLDFVDLNYEPYISEMDYVHMLDSVDGRHLNIWGAQKLTDWIGKYLTEHYDLTDVRGDKRYAFLEKQLQDYKEAVFSVDLRMITDPAEYLKTANAAGNYTIFLSVNKDAAGALTDEQREAFAQLGLTKLSEIAEGTPYIGIMQNQSVLHEDVPQKKKSAKNKSVKYEQLWPNNMSVSIISKKTESESTASCKLNGTELLPNTTGLNIAVYDLERNMLIDNTCFNTQKKSVRERKDYENELNDFLEQGIPYEKFTKNAKKVYKYKMMCAESNILAKSEYEIGTEDLDAYLEMFRGLDYYQIYLGVRGVGADLCEDKIRQNFADLDLKEMSDLKQIQQEANALDKLGVNVVVYNQFTETVLESRTFDIQAVTVKEQ